MKINFKSLAIIAVAVTMGMTACSKESDNNQSGENGEVTSVSIALSQNASTKSVGNAQGQTAVSFSDGYVVFTNSIGIVNKVTAILPGSFPGSSEQSAKDAGTKVWLDDMKNTGGSEIKNVPAGAKAVYVIGNLPQGVAAPVNSENILAVKNRIISIESQNRNDGTTDDVTLFGNGILVDDMPVAGAKYAEVNINAIASRIEIGKVSYVNATTNFITNFQIDGIFLNHYYAQMNLASHAGAYSPVNNTPATNAAADLMYAENTAAYPSAQNGLIYDFNAGGIGTGTSTSYEPAANKVWAYNVLAPQTFEAPATQIYAPHVIIRLSDIETVDDATLGSKVYTTTQYLTVREFKNKTTGDVISAFQPGYVYRISDLKFDESNLTDIPEAATVSVYVEAVLMVWTPVEVEWGF